MKNKLKLDIIGLICAVVLICICIAVIVVSIISGLNAVIIVAMVAPYVGIIAFCGYFCWDFIGLILKESEEEANAIMKETALELLKKEEEIKQLKAKLERKKK